MAPIKKRNLKEVIIPASIYSTDKRNISPTVEKIIMVINNAVRKERDNRKK